MSHRKVKVLRPGDDRKIVHGAGDDYAFLATGEDTDGNYFLVEAVVPPGGGPPPHIQTREEEGFYVLEGTLVFRAAGERVEAPAGTFLNVPAGVPHHFKNESDGVARLIFFFTPSGLERMFERMGKVSDEDAPKIGAEYGVKFVDEA